MVLSKRSPRQRAVLLTLGYVFVCLVASAIQVIIMRLDDVESTANSARDEASEAREMAEQTESDLSDLSDSVDDLTSQIEDLQYRLE